MVLGVIDPSNYCPDHPDFGECREYLEARAEQEQR